MNTLIKSVIVGAFVSSSLLADFARVEMGAGAWMSSASGEVSYTPSGGATARDVSTENKTTNPYVWVYIKHPIPVLPNIRLEYVNVNTKGLATGTFKEFSGATNAKTELDMAQFDIIPYYNILDNTGWLTLDLGLDIKVINTTYKADGVTPNVGGGTSYSDSATVALPLIYTRIRVEVPATDIGLEADVKFIKYSSSTVYDARVKVDYTLSFIPLIEPAIEIGYRVQKYDIDEADLGGKMNLEFYGVYVGAMLRF